MVSQPTGVAEVHDGEVTDDRIELATIAVARRRPRRSARCAVIERRGADTLWYRLDMAAVGEASQYHCEATLHRV